MASLRRLSGPSVIVAAVLCLCSVDVPTARAQTAPRDERMPIPGGTARLLRVARVPVPVEPARTLLVIVRSPYSIGPASGSPTVAVYLDAVSRLKEAGRRTEAGESRSLAPFLDACGFVRDKLGIHISPDPVLAERARLLEQAGFPVEGWMSSAAWLTSPTLSVADRVEVTRALTSAIADVDEVPALLPPSVWASAVFGRHVAPTLAAAILGDRRAALVYYGLFSLDDETLAFFARYPSLVSSVYRNAAEFAAFSDAVVIHSGRMVLPGDASAVRVWEDLVGAPATDPERFVTKLFSRDEGRLAWLFDTIAHLDAAHQAFALGGAIEEPEARSQHARSLYAVFANFERPGLSFAGRPFSRPGVRSNVDPAFILQQLGISADGGMAPPRDRRFWEAVAAPQGGAAIAASRPAQEVTAAWIVNRIVTVPPSSRRAYLDAVLFAQRLVAARGNQAPPIPFDAMVETARAVITHPLLMTTLERMAFTDPLDYVRAVHAADALARTDPLRASLALAQFQGALALLVRLHEVGTIRTAVAQGLARALFAQPGSDRAAGVASWLEDRLLHELPRVPTGTTRNVEEQLLDALAGASVERPTPIVQWEDHTYRVDVAAGERARLRRIRQKQADVDLGAVLDLRRTALRLLAPTTAAAEIRALAEKISEWLPGSDLLGGGGTLFGIGLPRLREATASAVRAFAEKPTDSDRKALAGQRLGEVADVLLADVLASLVYAVATGDPDAASLLSGNPARRHDFGLRVGGPWRIAEETRAEQGLAMTGSLLGLERALGRDWLRPITLDPPETGRRMNIEDVRGLGESVAALNAFRLADRGGDAVVAALGRGRERLRAMADSPVDLDVLVRSAGVEGWRRRLIRWTAARDPSRIWQYLSLGEVLQLGMQDPLAPDLQGWGTPRRAIDGSFDVQVPGRLGWQQLAGRPAAALMPAQVLDLQLHVLESLADLKLPAVLAPGVLSFAAWDLMMSAQMSEPDDWLAVIRAAQALSRDRIADYVSALTADGPLVPVREK